MLVHCQCDTAQLDLLWEEVGGPPLSGPPAGRGFGSRLAARAPSLLPGAALAQEWRPTGLLARLTIPRERLAAAEARPLSAPGRASQG